MDFDFLVVGTVMYPFLQFYSIYKAVKLWRYFAWAPLCVLVAFLLILLTSSSNLWPFIMMFITAISTVYLIIVILLFHLESRKGDNQSMS